MWRIWRSNKIRIQDCQKDLIIPRHSSSTSFLFFKTVLTPGCKYLTPILKNSVPNTFVNTLDITCLSAANWTFHFFSPPFQYYLWVFIYCLMRHPSSQFPQLLYLFCAPFRLQKALIKPITHNYLRINQNRKKYKYTPTIKW